ncbi:hypothetical protein [Cetacean poxvirus 1]|nr:hypothetical protein [Cetacean poxvirus 1]
MDYKLNVLVSTYFYGEFTTVDLMLLKKYLLNREPINTLICVDNDNNIVIDFDYSNCKASDYLCKEIVQLCPSKYKDHASDISIALFNLDISKLEADKFMKSSKIKKAINIYNNQTKICNAANILKISKLKDIDCSFLKNILF